MTARPSRRTTIAGLAAAGAAPLAGTAASPASASAGAANRGRRRALVGPARGRQLHLMSFNIRFDSADADPAGPDYWPTRRPALIELLEREQPTLLGVQEAEFNQLPAIARALPHHELVGFGRDGGSRGEFSAIYYDRRRFELLEWDQFWLSDTPTVIASKTWGNTVTRIVTWARLQDRRTRRELVHVNTHFDHQSENARVRSAEVIAALRSRFPELPVLLTGDFNAPAGASEPYRIITSAYADTWASAPRRLTPAYGTFPNYAQPVVGTNRIDWVLASPGVRVHAAAINAFRHRGVWPSDHTPVQALVELG